MRAQPQVPDLTLRVQNCQRLAYGLPGQTYTQDAHDVLDAQIAGRQLYPVGVVGLWCDGQRQVGARPLVVAEVQAQLSQPQLQAGGVAPIRVAGAGSGQVEWQGIVRLRM